MSEWKGCKLADAPLEILDGDRGKNYPSQDEFVDSGYCLFLSTRNVRENGFDFSECQYISKEKDEALRKGKLQRNDIVITTRGTIGNIGFFNGDVPFENIRINSGMVIVRPEISILDPRFNFYLFRKLQTDLYSFISGSAQPQLPIRDMKNIEVNLPPLQEQKAIASVLSSVDDKIDLLHRQNKTLEAMAETLFRQWFIEEADDGWEKMQLGDVVKVIDNRGKTPTTQIDETDFPVIEVNALTESSRLVNYKVIKKYVTEDVYLNWFRAGHPKLNDTLIGTVGSIGELAMFLIDKGSIAQNVVSLSATKTSCFYLYQFLKYCQNDIKELDIGSVQPSIKVPHLLAVEFIQPPSFILDRFDLIVSKIINKMKVNYLQIHTVEKLRDTLLPKLMSGEVRVKM